MSRHTNAVPPVVPAASTNAMNTMVREYKLITPLLGGGAKVKHPDSQTVVRASQIRGLLRFWWRAMRAGTCNGNVNALKEREAQIWGGRVGTTMHPSPIKIMVRNATLGTIVGTDADLIGGNPTPIYDVRSAFSYALFILRANQGAVDFKLYKDSQFTLEISYPESTPMIDYHKEVGAALWAWEMFGGIGARSRRGVGAVQLMKVDGRPMQYPTAQQLPEYIINQLQYFDVQGTWSTGIPNLANARVNQYGYTGASIKIIAPLQNQNSALRVWHKLVKRYRDFRQERFMRPNKANPGHFRPFGSSVWPDANAIRSAYGQPRHGQSNYGEQAHAPRAQLGLPMVVQFMPNKFVHGTGQMQFILDNQVGRHASPVIFRPVAVDGGGYVGVLLILGNSRIADTVNLKGNDVATR
ncbi:MAG: type III-B CRISPR module RAMP protein Cmr1, partial [Chloroflexia bacterium]|nr:type III-B CRISPR module RAMP protein Cmr1 [Chloroflexia bacterium]